MFTLIKNANLYSPEHLGMNDVLLADDKIALIDRKIELTGIPLNTIDADGCAVTPALSTSTSTSPVAADKPAMLP